MILARSSAAPNILGPAVPGDDISPPNTSATAVASSDQPPADGGSKMAGIEDHRHAAD
jgi:hypothetical protein